MAATQMLAAMGTSVGSEGPSSSDWSAAHPEQRRSALVPITGLFRPRGHPSQACIPDMVCRGGMPVAAVGRRPAAGAGGMGEAAAHAARAAVCGFVAGIPSSNAGAIRSTGPICTIYLPIMALHSPQTASGYVQSGPNRMGSIRCTGTTPAASQYGCADGHRARRPNHSTDDCRRDRR
jgi:hypothetical protein